MRAERPPERLLLYLSPPHACGYLDDREATTVFADPAVDKNPPLYAALSELGFRRSGEHLYRPHCQGCVACVPVRVPVAAFRARRRHRRAWSRNRDLHVSTRPSTFDEEHYALYRRYVASRHPGGSMDNQSPRQYRDFLMCSWAETRFYEFRYGTRLLAVAVTDRLPHALSAVYTFFDPACAERSLGVYAVLWQIEEARRLQLEWLYLGYWIGGSPKMRYKADYRPQQRLIKGEWVDA